MADLMLVTTGCLRDRIIRLVQLSRAVGIHLVMATQRPIVKFIDGTIKANMPSRISFKVASAQDSRVILDTKGAEQLNGCGDMLMVEKGHMTRYQGIYINEEQIKNIVNSIQ
jgi:DNA segregation ATPase FtsK/SpoIIIE, S-DNA-T family